MDVAAVKKELEERKAREDALLALQRRAFEENCDELRSKLLTFVEDIILRQDEKDEINTFETF